MDKKDAKLLEKLFWEDDHMHYNFRTFEQVEANLKKAKKEKTKISLERQKINFEERYESIASLRAFEKGDAEELNKYFDSLPISYKTPDHILTIGIYNAYKTGDMKILKDALYTHNRINYPIKLTTISGSKTHARNFAEVIYAFADCDLDLAKKYFPEKLGLAEANKHHMTLGSNLIISLIYSNQEWLKESIALGEKINEKANLKSSVLVIRYLISLAREDVRLASKLLQEIADSYKKITWLFSFKNPFLKFFGAYIHGLYNFGHFVLPKAKFLELKVPEHSVFWEEFDHHTKENNFNKGNLCLKIDDEIKELNALFT